jgi:uncharacterized glyoxalase superfamily protein PhnB
MARHHDAIIRPDDGAARPPPLFSWSGRPVESGADREANMADVIFPPPCSEIPVAALAPALAYYRAQLGFTVDWADEALGLAGLSRGDARIFMADAGYRAGLGNQAPLVLWLNLASREEVDGLHGEWAAAGARIAAPPQAQPYRLYEFFAHDLDGNVLRVFYDFGWEEDAARAGEP